MLGLNCAVSSTDSARVAKVVTSAIHLAARTVPASSALANKRRIRIAATPISGAKVTRERMGMLGSPLRVPGPEGVGEDGRDAQQHHEGVVVDVAGLQATRPLAHRVTDRRDAVGAQAVDDPLVAALP